MAGTLGGSVTEEISSAPAGPVRRPGPSGPPGAAGALGAGGLPGGLGRDGLGRGGLGRSGLPADGLVAGYQIEAEIGRGGMATVYRARDLKLDRLVALKILAPRLAENDTFRRRFIHESRSAAAVDHPHIVPVFEAGESRGVLFIAMRYVGPGDVRTLLKRYGTLPVERVIAITSQVASAIDAAHARGVVHRDIKPANMLLAESADGRADHVYLSDFGLSKDALAPSGLTSTGVFMGTLDYVAPEQIEGRRVDGRADQYALAAATVEMLTGAPPFRRDENLALMWAQLSEPPPPVSQRRPDLPPAVDQVIGRALAKPPDHRYPSCMDFAAALRMACAVQPPRGAPHPRPAGPGSRQLAGHPAPGAAYQPAPTRADPVPPRAPGPGPRAPGPDRRAPRSGHRASSRSRWRGQALAVVAVAVILLAGLAVLGDKLHSRHAAPAVAQTAPAASAHKRARPAKPGGTVVAYFRAINRHHWPVAWRLGGRNSGRTYAQFVSGFSGTAHDAVHILSVTGDTVSVRLTATQADGSVQHYQGTYTITRGQITHADVNPAS